MMDTLETTSNCRKYFGIDVYVVNEKAKAPVTLFFTHCIEDKDCFSLVICIHTLLQNEDLPYKLYCSLTYK